MNREKIPHSANHPLAGRRLRLKGFRLLERQPSPWYVDDFGLRTRIHWVFAPPRSIVIHNLAADPAEVEPERRHVHLSYRVELISGHKSDFRIHAVHLDGVEPEVRRRLLDTLERAMELARRNLPRPGGAGDDGG